MNNPPGEKNRKGINMIYAHELTNRNLHPMVQATLLMAANMIEQGAEVTVCLTAPKVTDTAPRIGGGQDYLTLPGIAPDAQIGPMTVHRYVDNPENRREVLLGLTDAGRRLVRRVTAARRSEITRIVAAMPETRRDELVMAMRAFAEAAHEPEPRPETTAAFGW